MDKNADRNWQIKRIGNVVLPWIVPILILFIWYEATLPERNFTMLPTPYSVLERAIIMGKSGELWANIYISAERAIKGLILGGLIGLALAFATGLSKIADRTLDTTIQMFRTIPVLAIISLMIIWFGIGEQVKVYLIAFGVFFPIYINTYHGIKTIDKGLLEMAKVYGLKPWQVFWTVILPGALPSMIVGLKLALGIMWLVLVAAEQIATDAGLGYMAMSARELLQMDKIVLAIIIYAILGKLSDIVATFVEHILIRWRTV